MINKHARKGLTPSQIGVLLRDQSGVPLVSGVTSSKILRVLKGSGLAPEIPEDLYFLIKKAGGWCVRAAVRSHKKRLVAFTVR